MEYIEECINCGLCSKECPVSAISYEYKNGFKIATINKDKCIKCNRCVTICPLKKEYLPVKSPKTIIMRLKDQYLINKSSSGGVFGEIAREYIKRGYIVYGAKYDKNLNLIHKRISRKNEINEILKSKYVQSDISQIFSSVKEDLVHNKQVIFSGTSCQIAALKQFLKKDYSNLLTIDLICHGVPSPQIWKNYNKHLEKSNGSKVKKIDFRFNNKKDLSKNFKIEFENGKKIETSLYESNYGWGFLNNVILNKSCYNCKFKNSKTLSDLTIGDAHGFNNEKYQNKFSLVIINSLKGKDIIDTIENKFETYKDYDMEVLISNNYPILYSSLQHPNSKYILNNIEEYTKKGRLPDYKNNQIKYDKKNIGILNFYYENYNYGANLVAYSISEVIKKLGYIPYIINFNPFPAFSTFEQFKTIGFTKFREKYLNLTKEYKKSEELYETNKFINAYIVGSDQVWRKTITQNNFTTYFLDFVNWNKKCISYGASFGNDCFEGTIEEQKECELLLKKFVDISVREEDATYMLDNLFNVKSTQVIDPTLLLTNEDYEELIKKENQKDIKKDYIAVYCLFEQDSNFVEDIKRLFKNKEIIDIKQKSINVPLLNKDLMQYRTIPEWINLIKNASFVVTDSYHGMLFSIIFNKEFICLGKNSKAKSRFDTINNILKGNIDKRIIASIKEIENQKDIPKLNYDEINNCLEFYRKKSINFLKNALKKPVKENNAEILDKYHNLVSNSKKIIEKLQEEEKKIIIEKRNITADLVNTYNQYVDISNKYNELIQENEKNQENIKELKNICENNAVIIEKKNNLINEKETIINEKNNIIKNIMNSNSWKITKPLRIIREKVSRKNEK